MLMSCKNNFQLQVTTDRWPSLSEVNKKHFPLEILCHRKVAEIFAPPPRQKKHGRTFQMINCLLDWLIDWLIDMICFFVFCFFLDFSEMVFQDFFCPSQWSRLACCGEIFWRSLGSIIGVVGRPVAVGEPAEVEVRSSWLFFVSGGWKWSFLLGEISERKAVKLLCKGQIL